MFKYKKQDKDLAKPFLKWAGGKTQLLEEISNAIPNEVYKWEAFTYIEPFVGSGAVLFWMLNNYPNIKKAVINDINPDLTKAFITIKENPKKLIAKLNKIQNSYHTLNEESNRKEFFLNKRTEFNKRNVDDIENTALMIFLNRTCFNGLFRVNSKGGFNVPFGKYTNPKICDEKTILANSIALKKVTILNGDFEESIKYADKNTLFYFDPPYKPLSKTSSFNTYYKDEFGDNEQNRLKIFCDKVDSKGYSFILSNSDVRSNDPENNFFDKLYSSYNIKRVWATRMLNSNPEKRGKLTELLITNNTKKDYIPAIEFNKEDLFVKNFDKPYWVITDKVNIKKIKIDSKKFAFHNPIIDSQVNQIVEQFDINFWIPITVDKEFYLLDGQHRLKAAKKMNLKYIDVVVQDTELLESTPKNINKRINRKFIL